VNGYWIAAAGSPIGGPDLNTPKFNPILPIRSDGQGLITPQILSPPSDTDPMAHISSSTPDSRARRNTFLQRRSSPEIRDPMRGLPNSRANRCKRKREPWWGYPGAYRRPWWRLESRPRSAMARRGSSPTTANSRPPKLPPDAETPCVKPTNATEAVDAATETRTAGISPPGYTLTGPDINGYS
jgi:hypothetical protein